MFSVFLVYRLFDFVWCFVRVHIIFSPSSSLDFLCSCLLLCGCVIHLLHMNTHTNARIQPNLPAVSVLISMAFNTHTHPAAQCVCVRFLSSLLLIVAARHSLTAKFTYAHHHYRPYSAMCECTFLSPNNFTPSVRWPIIFHTHANCFCEISMSEF